MQTENLRNEVGLEFIEIDVEGTIEAQRGCDRRDNLSNQAIQVGKARG